MVLCGEELEDHLKNIIACQTRYTYYISKNTENRYFMGAIVAIVKKSDKTIMSADRMWGKWNTGAVTLKNDTLFWKATCQFFKTLNI